MSYQANETIILLRTEVVDRISGEVFDPGWYFIDEDGFKNGPFSTNAECNEAFNSYMFHSQSGEPEDLDYYK